jgi:hypothetical protein
MTDEFLKNMPELPSQASLFREYIYHTPEDTRLPVGDLLETFGLPRKTLHTYNSQIPGATAWEGAGQAAVIHVICPEAIEVDPPSVFNIHLPDQPDFGSGVAGTAAVVMPDFFLRPGKDR